MFESIRLRYFIAKARADLKVQSNNQKFVNLICELPTNEKLMATLREQAYFLKDKNAHFIVMCIVLGESLTSSELSFEMKLTCSRLLAERMERVSGSQFRLRHLMIFGELEEKLLFWWSENGIEI